MAYRPRRTRPRHALNGAAAAPARRTCCWRTAKIATVMLAMCEWRSSQAAQRTLMDITDHVEAEDLELSGNCGGGCVRQVVDAVAPALGEIDCELRVENLLDHTDQDVAGGSLNVVHSCSDADGNLLYQDEGACRYSVCATARWEGDRFAYSVAVEHESDTEPHSVRIQVYVNEYEDVPGQTSQVGGLTTTSSPAASASASSPGGVIDISCDLGETCSPASECNSISTGVEVLMEDEYGDGWAGALPGRVDTWSITQALSASDLTSPVGDGSLSSGHYSAVKSLCLEDGHYTFTSTANSAWSSEASWTVCGVQGGSGGTLEFEVGGGTCKSVDDSAASGPPSTDSKTSSDDYCSLPDDSPCIGLDVGVVELSGLSVGMYYDEACLEGGGGVSGCGGGGVTECRLCFVNREFWQADFPDARYPDWNDCPCCVADALGVTCQGGLVETAPSGSFIGKAKAFYTGGSFAMIATVSAIIALGVLTAICCYRGIHKDQQKALTYKHSRSAIYEDFNDGGTSPDVSPPLRAKGSSSAADPTKPGERRQPHPDAKKTAVPTTAARLSAAEAGKPAHGRKPRQQQPHKPRGKAPRRDGGPVPPAPAATVGSAAATAATALDRHPPRRSALPPVEAHTALRLPGAAKDRPPSDASWPSDPRVGISVSGKKNPRWSGGRELKAYLRRTGYDKVEPEDMEHDAQPPSRLEGAAGNRMLQAMKSASSRLSDKSKKYDWVEDPQRVDIGGENGVRTGKTPEMEGRQISMMDIMAALDLDDAPSSHNAASPEVPLGDLPVQPPPPPGDVAPIPARITVARDKNGRSNSKSRPRPRGGKGTVGNGDRGNAAAADDEDRRMPSRPSRGGSTKSRSRRVVPTEDAEDAEELHTLDKAFAEQNWNAPSVEAPHAPAPPSPSTLRDGGGNELRPQRHSAGHGLPEGERRGNGHSTTANVAAAALRAEAAETVQRRRQGRSQEARGGADRTAERGHRSRSEAKEGQNRHRSSGEVHQHRSGQGQEHQHRGRESERRGHGDAGAVSNDASRGVRSKTNPPGPDRETEGERRRRRARDEGHDSSQGREQRQGGRSRERRAHRSEHRSENRAGHGARSSSQGQAYASSGREKSVEAHQERHERRKSAGRKDIHKMLMQEERRVSQERTSKSPGPPQERGQPRAAREEKRASGGREGESRPVAKARVAAVVATSAPKKPSSTRFSSDPRARRERAERLRQRQANATGRGEE